MSNQGVVDIDADAGATDSPGGLVIVTLDSCRADSAQFAVTPFLDSSSRFSVALAMATFTLPAHVALFHGFLPVPVGRGREDTGIVHLTRLSPKLSEEPALVAALHSRGSWLVGAAGMRWFELDQLRVGFDEFHYWAPARRPEDREIPAWNVADYALSRTDFLVERLMGRDRWCLFINAAETHAPYMTSDGLLDLIREYASARNGKLLLSTDRRFKRLMRDLHEAQVEAVAWADSRLAELFSKLPKPFSFVVTADHGECFGEDGIWGHVVAHSAVAEVPFWAGSIA